MPPISPSLLRIASVSLGSQHRDTLRNTAAIAAVLAEAAVNGIRLVIFPEACVADYDPTSAFRPQALQLRSEALSGPSIEALADAVERTGVAAGVGFIERSGDGRLFNSYVVCMPGGARHCHRKLHAHEHACIDSGEQFTVFDTPWGVKVGILIGADNYLIENVRITALMGATLLLAPHRRYRWGDAGAASLQPLMPRSSNLLPTAPSNPEGTNWLRRSLVSHAANNGMFVALCDSFEADAHHISSGTGMIVDPCGRVLAENALAAGAWVAAGVDTTLIESSVGQQCLTARRADLYGRLGRSVHRHADAAIERRSVASQGSIAISLAQIRRES